jgi:hypothetical protein
VSWGKERCGWLVTGARSYLMIAGPWIPREEGICTRSYGTLLPQEGQRILEMIDFFLSHFE